MKLRAHAVALTLLLVGCNVGPGEPDPRYTYAEAGFDTVRIVQLPSAGLAYVLKDRVSGHCFTYISVPYHSELRQVTDDVCGPA